MLKIRHWSLIVLLKTNSSMYLTRWSSRSIMLCTIVNEWPGPGFIQVFEFINEDPKSLSESIQNHLKNLKPFEFACNLIDSLQNKPFDTKYYSRKINITCVLTNKKRNYQQAIKRVSKFVNIFTLIILTKPPASNNY